jgi:Zn-dependent peptidase ImmA (M78 family)
MDKTLNAKTIDEQTLSLLESVFGDVSTIKLPIDLNRVAQYYGLTIRQGNFKNDKIEGAFDRTKRTVYLSRGDTFQEKNFTLAHEIGHYRLHDEINQDVFTMYQLSTLLARQGTDKIEDQANLFAASLLMPAKHVKTLWLAANKDVDTLSKIFGVPVPVAIYRLRTLNLI